VISLNGFLSFLCVWQHKEEGIRFFLQEKNYLTNPSARNFRTTPKKLTSLQNAKFFAVSGLAREDIQDKDSPVDFDHFITKPLDVSYVETLF
jgi:hypothetical protein